LALVLPIVVEVDKWIKRRRMSTTVAPEPVEVVVNPARAVTAAA
jgi:hypothetical protein